MIYARTNLDAARHKAISALLVKRGDGVEVQHVYGLMGTRGGGTGRVYFRDVRVPVESLIGREHGAYEVFNRMMIPERMIRRGWRARSRPRGAGNRGALCRPAQSLRAENPRV